MIQVILNWSKLELKNFFWVPTVIVYMIKKELDVHLRVPGNARKKRFGYHPTLRFMSIKFLYLESKF